MKTYLNKLDQQPEFLFNKIQSLKYPSYTTLTIKEYMFSSIRKITNFNVLSSLSSYIKYQHKSLVNLADERSDPENRMVTLPKASSDQRGEKNVAQTRNNKYVARTRSEKNVAPTRNNIYVARTRNEKNVAQTRNNKYVARTRNEKSVAPTRNNKYVARTRNEKGVAPTRNNRYVARTKVRKCGFDEK